MAAQVHIVKPAVGMTLAFKATSSPSLADIPARVTHVWPRFRSGDYLVTLEFSTPVKVGSALVRHIDAFVSELYQPVEHLEARSFGQVTTALGQAIGR